MLDQRQDQKIMLKHYNPAHYSGVKDGPYFGIRDLNANVSTPRVPRWSAEYRSDNKYLGGIIASGWFGPTDGLLPDEPSHTPHLFSPTASAARLRDRSGQTIGKSSHEERVLMLT